MKKIILLCFYAGMLYAQDVKTPLKATGNLQITNNGISLFPNFTLGKPAAILNLYVGKKNFFFEPEFRWSLKGEPWSFIFWFRYKYKKEKFGLNLGAHPAYILGNTAVGINSKTENRWVSQRYAAWEVAPSWYANDKFSLGVHYIGGRGLDEYAIPRSTFISLQPRFPKISLGEKVNLGVFPQLFHLTLGEYQGAYVSESAVLSIRNFPVTLSEVATYKLSGDVAGDTFVWSAGLNFKF